jgi:hypothetical protein
MTRYALRRDSSRFKSSAPSVSVSVILALLLCFKASIWPVMHEYDSHAFLLHELSWSCGVCSDVLSLTHHDSDMAWRLPLPPSLDFPGVVQWHPLLPWRDAQLLKWQMIGCPEALSPSKLFMYQMVQKKLCILSCHVTHVDTVCAYCHGELLVIEV